MNQFFYHPHLKKSNTEPEQTFTQRARESLGTYATYYGIWLAASSIHTRVRDDAWIKLTDYHSNVHWLLSLLKLGLKCFRRAKIERTQFPLSLKIDAVTLRIQFTGKYASSKIVFSYCLKHVTCQGVAEDREAGMASIGVNRMLFQDNNNDDDEYSSTLKIDARRYLSIGHRTYKC